MKSYKYVIFDLDGTILDSVVDIVNALNLTLKHFNIDRVYDRDEGITLLGGGAFVLVQKVFKSCGLDAESPFFDKFIEVYFQNYIANQGKTGVLFAGVKEMLLELNKRNIKYAIFSNKPQKVITGALQGKLDEKDFLFILGHKDGYAPKPDTKAILEEVSKHNIDLTKTLYVGDSDVDIILAKNLGVDGCGCAYGYRSKSELIKAGATFVIDSPLELLKHIS